MDHGVGIPETFCLKLRNPAEGSISSHEGIEELRGCMSDKFVDALHVELNRQTAVYDERVEPLRRVALHNLWVTWIESALKLATTTPTTAAGLLAWLTYIRDNQDLKEQIGCGMPHVDRFFDTLVAASRAVQSAS
jgi:hypothetical protein